MILDIIEIGLPLLTGGFLIRCFPRIIGLSKVQSKTNKDSSSGSPYRNQGEVLEDSENKTNFDIDDQSRLRWRGKTKFICQACGGTSCDDIHFCVGGHKECKGCSENGSHIHVHCKNCGCIDSFGMMFPGQRYRE